MSTFIRLLKTDDKAEGLRSAIQSLHDGIAHPDVYYAHEKSFRQIPNSPFAYWVSDRVRRISTASSTATRASSCRSSLLKNRAQLLRAPARSGRNVSG